MSAASAASSTRALRAAGVPARTSPPRGRPLREQAARAVAARPAPRTTARATRPGETARATAPRVRLVAPPSSARRRLPFGLLCGLLVLASLLGVLLLNISLSQGAYELHALQRDQRAAVEERQALAERLESTSSPGELARRATEQGMVPAGPTAFVALPEGRLVGTTAPAEDVPLAEGVAPAPLDPSAVAADEPAPAEAAAEAAASAAERGVEAGTGTPRTSASQTDASTQEDSP